MKKHLIIFVHGFLGSKKSFSNHKNIKFHTLLTPHIRNNFDFKYYDYYSEVDPWKIRKYFTILNTFSFIKYIPLINTLVSKEFNVNIDLNSQTLETYYQNQLHNGYESINFICHSMGGLVVKNFLINKFENYKQFNGFYITLSTPHQGINMSKHLSFINPQASEIEPSSKTIIDLTKKWEKYRNKVGFRKYYCGTSDLVSKYEVSYPKNEANENRKVVPENHFSISKPTSKNSIFIDNINIFIEKFLKMSSSWKWTILYIFVLIV